MATHFPEMATFLDAYPNVVNLHLQVSDGAEYTYKVETGMSAETHYGLKLAQSIGYPAEVVKYAQELSVKHEALMKQRKVVEEEDEEYCRTRKVITTLNGMGL